MIVEKELTRSQQLERQFERQFKQQFEQRSEQLVHEGRQQGRVEGEARLLHRQLERRFGPLPEKIETKLTAATEDDLVRWGEKVIDARSLDEIFAC